jgi:hypothetical protein
MTSPQVQVQVHMYHARLPYCTARLNRYVKASTVLYVLVVAGTVWYTEATIQHISCVQQKNWARTVSHW